MTRGFIFPAAAMERMDIFPSSRLWGPGTTAKKQITRSGCRSTTCQPVPAPWEAPE